MLYHSSLITKYHIHRAVKMENVWLLYRHTDGKLIFVPSDTSEQVKCREEITNGSAAVGGYVAGRRNGEDT